MEKKIIDILSDEERMLFETYLFFDEVEGEIDSGKSEKEAQESAKEVITFWLNKSASAFVDFWDDRYSFVNTAIEKEKSCLITANNQTTD